VVSSFLFDHIEDFWQVVKVQIFCKRKFKKDCDWLSSE